MNELQKLKKAIAENKSVAIEVTTLEMSHRIQKLLFNLGIFWTAHPYKDLRAYNKCLIVVKKEIRREQTLFYNSDTRNTDRYDVIIDGKLLKESSNIKILW